MLVVVAERAPNVGLVRMEMLQGAGARSPMMISRRRGLGRGAAEAVRGRRARPLALLLHPSGQVLGADGFARAVDVMSACALAAGIHASPCASSGDQLDGKPLPRCLHHAGVKRQIFLAEAGDAARAVRLLTVFDDESSLGLVQLYFEELATASGAADAAGVRDAAPMLDENFERELNRNLAMLFGRAPGRRNITPTS